VLLSATPAYGKQSSAGRSISPLNGFVLEADGGNHADVLSVHRCVSGLGLRWEGTILGVPLNSSKQQGVMPVWQRGDQDSWCSRNAASAGLWCLPEVLTQLKDE